MTHTRRRIFASVVLGAGALLAACGGGDQQADTSTPATPQPAVTPGAPITPPAGREVFTIEMVTDDEGNNKFIPSELEVHQGDVLRFTLVSGVHNAHFLPDSNPGLQKLPPATPLLQVPGQTYDLAVDFPPGRYYFQCDPHALLGMIGYLKVEAADR